MHALRPALLACLAFLAVISVPAVTITDGFTYAVASDSDHTLGTHFHSNTGGAFGNPAGKGEVGAFLFEEVRGLSEYNLTGLSSAVSAFVTFQVFKAGGLFAGANDFPFSGTIDVIAYSGNNLEDISDYHAASIGTVGSFSTAGLAVGDTISLDITAIFNAHIAGGSPSLGIRLSQNGVVPNAGGAWTFDTFRLTSDNQATTVPEPSAFVLMGMGALALWVKTRYQR